jgi:hypothetical protein
MNTYIRSCEHFEVKARVTLQIYYQIQKRWKKISRENDLQNSFPIYIPHKSRVFRDKKGTFVLFWCLRNQASGTYFGKI